MSGESFDEKIRRLDAVKPQMYLDSFHLGKDASHYADRFPLFHGLRFHPIEKLESIFQSQFVLCGKKVPRSIVSYNGETKYLYVSHFSKDNCNRGEYVSVMPYLYGNNEFDIFVRENVFLVLRGDIPAQNTVYVYFDDYLRLRESDKKTKNIFSYAHNEYMVKDGFTIDNITAIGIDSSMYRGDYPKTIQEVTELMKQYNISVPFYDMNSGKILYQQPEGHKEFD